MSETIPEGAVVEVELKIRVPKAATYEQVEEWLRFCLRDNGTMESANPLGGYEPEPWGNFSFDWRWDGDIGREERSNYQEHPDGRKSWSVRYITERSPDR